MPIMAMNSEAPAKHGGGGGESEKRLTSVETRLTVIEKTMVTAEVFQREFGALRSEMHDGFGALRGAMHGGFGALRGKMHGALGDLRKEMHAENGVLRDELAKIPFETVKWLLAVFGIAAAITTTVYNIWFR